MTRDTFSSELGDVHEPGGARERDSFSSELGDVHERGPGRARDSFSNEFRGVSDTLIQHERPSTPLDAGRRGRRVIWLSILSLALACGAAWAVWYWSAEIGAWISDLGRQEPEPEPEPEPELVPTPVDLPPAEPAADKVFGIKGTPDGYDGTPVPEPVLEPDDPTNEPDDPSTPTPTPTPSPTGATVEVLATSVRGRVSEGSISGRLAKLDGALESCWKQTNASAPVELELSFGIKWNGRAQAVSVSGGSDALAACVKAALPTSGWPQPSDGGEATVTRRWKLGR